MKPCMKQHMKPYMEPYMKQYIKPYMQPHMQTCSPAQAMEEALQVTAKKPRVQLALGKFWKQSPSQLEMKPAMEATAERMKDGHAVKRRVGRPSNADKAIEEARRHGEELIVATIEQHNEAILKQARNMRLFADRGGRIRVRGPADALTSKRKRQAKDRFRHLKMQCF